MGKRFNKACLAYLYFSLTYSYCFALRENRCLALNSLTKSSLLTISVKIYPYLSLFIFEEEFLPCMPNVFKINNKINWYKFLLFCSWSELVKNVVCMCCCTQHVHLSVYACCVILHAKCKFVCALLWHSMHKACTQPFCWVRELQPITALLIT